MKLLSRFSVTAFAVVLANLPPLAQACSVCMGDPNTNSARGANAVLFLMLAILAGMFSLLTAFGFYLYRRAKLPIPPHQELGDLVGNAQTEGGI